MHTACACRFPRPQVASANAVEQLREMFPDFDDDVIVSVLGNSNNNQAEAIEALLEFM